ncbi:MAG TPA: phosphatidate cytidylyltransferase [Fibrobacteraceae bacterium]|nr:phosphatidate cytidylyltransferase [Fibrobacteraceae bacterium]
MNNLVIRVVFALVAIPICLFLIWFNEASRLTMITALIAVTSWEWARMVTQKIGGPSMAIASPAVSILFVLAWIFSTRYPIALPSVAVMAAAYYLSASFASVGIANLFPWLAMHALGPIYLGLWGGMLVRLLGPGHGFSTSAPFIFVMISMWVCDTFAYFTGRLLGRHKMAPEISPKKTWEGAFGGTIATMALFVLLGPLVFHSPLWVNLILGILLSIAGQAGDLFESALKRWADTKDSSHLFPGHGGVFDRLDSLFLAGPLTVVIFAWIRG